MLATSTLQTAWSLPKLSRQVCKVSQRYMNVDRSIRCSRSDVLRFSRLTGAAACPLRHRFLLGRSHSEHGSVERWRPDCPRPERWSGRASDLLSVEKQDSDAGQPVRTVYSVTVLLAKIVGRLVRDGVDKLLYRRRWSLIARAAEEFSADFGDYRPLVPPESCAWADPCALTRGERHYLFIEQIPPGTSKGHLAVLEMNAEEIIAHPQVILEKPYHLSHPFVFEWGRGHLYGAGIVGERISGFISLHRFSDPVGILKEPYDRGSGGGCHPLRAQWPMVDVRDLGRSQGCDHPG